MKSFKEYLRLNESVVDQYLAVRDETDKSMKVVDKYHKTKKGGFLDTVLPHFFKPVVKSSMPGQGVNSSQKATTPKIGSTLRFGSLDNNRGHYDPTTGIANTLLTDRTQRDAIHYLIAHELAHSYQHNAQYRNIKVNKLPSRMLGDRKTAVPPLISEFGTKKAIIGGSIGATVGGTIGAVAGAIYAASAADAAGVEFDSGGANPIGRIVGAGLGAAHGALGTIIGARIKTPNYSSPSQYWNSDTEVNSRAIGNAVRLLGGHAPDDSNFPLRRRDSYNHQLANSLIEHPYDSSSDLISRERMIHLFRYSKMDWDGEGLVTPENVEKGKNIFGRILQHHEEQLPSDIHTPEGRQAFIRTHSTERSYR